MEKYSNTLARSIPSDKPQDASAKITIEQAAAKDERLRELARDRARGFVVRSDGEYVVIASDVEEESLQANSFWAVGQLVSVKVGANRLVGLVCEVKVSESNWSLSTHNKIEVTAEMIGEIVTGQDGRENRFSRGIANYPTMGCVAHHIRAADLEQIYRTEGDSIARIGHLTQDASVDAKINVDSLLSRHFAVLGSTGVGKSTATTLLLKKTIKIRSEIRVLILDPHNEFASSFSSKAHVIDANNLHLPFWLFRHEEFSEVVFRGQQGFDSEREILRDLIPMAKEEYRESQKDKASLLTRKTGKSNLTADTPVPYRLQDLLQLIDDRLGLLEGKAEKPLLKTLRYRLESISQDPRFRFMFEVKGGDIFEKVASEIFRLPQCGKPICVLEMSGLPGEVVNSVVSVLCRMAFDLAQMSDGAIQTLVVCEEAHRYIPADEKAGFWPTRSAIARIAKEGRKYGVYLGIITQRPSELDPTILSQCNTIFAMRLGNEQDQEIIRGAVTNGARSTIGFLSSIANRECIAFGEALHTPMRLTFETIEKSSLPGAWMQAQRQKLKMGVDVSLNAVLKRMRQENTEQEKENSAPSQQVLQTGFTRVEPRSRSAADDINMALNAAYQPPSSKTPISVPGKSQSMFGGGSNQTVAPPEDNVESNNRPGAFRPR